MKLQELQELAERVQLKIKPEETDYLLTSLSEMERLLVRFRKLKLKINLPYCLSSKITLKDLRQLAEKFSIHASKQETIHHNAILSVKNFLIVRRKKGEHIKL